ncbi:MAG TPA: NAD(P)/FAD-dependent oxidoreductase [Micromonosporaceae bacterium]
MVEHVQVLIVGSGFGGLGTAIALKRDGVDDFVVLERADDLGGTWRDNSYPGCACDVPSHLYSFSFAPNPNWSRTFSRQPEIWAYLRDCADRYGIAPHIRFGTELLGADWDDERRRWVARTSRGEFTADVLVAATGPLAEPSLPDLPGLSTFAGTAFHSARWDHGYDLTGKRVAVIGTGASAIQFVPQIAGRVARLDVYQRTPPWIMPRRDRPLTRVERRVYRAVPALQRLMRAAIYAGREAFLPNFRSVRVSHLAQRIALRHLRSQVPDPDLRAKLTPNYAMGCKRILVSNDYLPALTRDNVHVVTDPIAEVRRHSIVTADGTEREADAIVFGTGFHVTDLPIAERLRGRDGRSLAEIWQGSPQAYLGVAVAGFPNLFLLLGPNTGLGHTSVVIMIEAQIGYLRRALRHLRATGAATVEPRPDAQRDFVRYVDENMRGTVWTAGGCRSWYLDPTGRNSALWPRSTWAYRRLLRRFRPDDHEFSLRAQPKAEVPV